MKQSPNSPEAITAPVIAVTVLASLFAVPHYGWAPLMAVLAGLGAAVFVVRLLRRE